MLIQSKTGYKDFHKVTQFSHLSPLDKLRINFQDEPKKEVSEAQTC